jgi:hypothetical protein
VLSTLAARGVVVWGMRAAAVLIAAATVDVASPGLATASATSKVVHVATVGNANSSDQSLLLTGGLGDAGTLAVNGPTDTVTLSRGTLTIDLSKAEGAENKLFSHLKALVNPQSCSMNASYTAPVKVMSGTGSYAGISGTLVIRTAEIGVFPRTSSGSCDLSSNAQPVGFLSIGQGSGSLKVES